MCGLLAAAAAGLAAWLWYQKLTGTITSLAGCGGEGGCSQLLGGRWSAWFGVPVSFPAMLNYAALAAAAFALGIGVRSRCWAPIACAAMLLGSGAALWFLAVQGLIVKEWCPYCSTIHGLGVAASVVGGLALVQQRKAEKDEEATWVPWTPLAGGAAAALAILVAGQVLGPAPKSHAVVDTAGESLAGTPTSPGPDPAGTAAPGGAAPAGTPDAGAPETDADGQRIVTFYNGSLRLKPATLPLVGSPDAPFVMAKVFDYTCSSCRTMHDHLKQAERAYPGRFAVIMLPAPINRACNDFVPAGVGDHADACELAKLALAVWAADRTKFEAFNEFLFDRGALISPAMAQQEAERLVGGDALDAGAKSEAASQMLAQTTRLFGSLTRNNPRMPKLLVRDGVTIEGVARDGREFVRTLEQHLRLTVPGSGS